MGRKLDPRAFYAVATMHGMRMRRMDAVGRPIGKGMTMLAFSKTHDKLVERTNNASAKQIYYESTVSDATVWRVFCVSTALFRAKGRCFLFSSPLQL